MNGFYSNKIYQINKGLNKKVITINKLAAQVNPVSF